MRSKTYMDVCRAVYLGISGFLVCSHEPVSQCQRCLGCRSLRLFPEAIDTVHSAVHRSRSPLHSSKLPLFLHSTPLHSSKLPLFRCGSAHV